nr:histone deacetylase 14 [Tanacetum cinerariifolium]
HPRPDSPLHLPNEEPFLGYLKFSAKGTKREFFGMLIPGKLITADIQGEPYYKEYLEKVAKHQRYLVGKKGSDPDSPALKLTKATKKSKVSAPKADLRPPVIKPASSQPPEPKPTPAKSHEKKHKSVDEGIPKKEPRFDDEEADVQRTLEESLLSVYDAPQGPLPPMVIREPERTSTLTESSGHDESSSLYAEFGLIDSEVESDEDVAGIDVEVQDEGQAGPNPGEQDEGQARLNPGDAVASQPQSSPVVHARPNLEHMDLEATDVSTHLHPEQINEGFTATTYPNVQENLKLTVEVQVILEEPASSTGTLSSLQHLAKDLSFGDLFFNDKPSEADNEKTTTETKAESMVSVIIQQDTSRIPPMTTPIIDLTSRPNSPNVHRPLQATATETTMTTTTTTHPPPPQPQQSTTDSMLMKRIGELEQIMANLIQDNRHLEESTQKEEKRCDSPKMPHGSPPHQPPPPPPPAGPSGTLGSLGIFRSSQVPPPPPPPPSTNQEGQSHGSTTPTSSKTAALAEYKAWTMTDTRLRLSQDWWKPLEEDRSATLEPAWSILSSGLPVPKNNWASALASTYSPPPEDSLLAQTGDIAMFIDWFCKRQGITELKPQDLEVPVFKLVKVFHPNMINLRYQMEECHKLLTDSVDDSIIRHNFNKPLPLGGPPGQMKAAYYPDVGLEKVVPDQMWIEEECKYDIAAIAVRTHMRILSVVKIEVFSMYGSPEPSTTQRQEDSHYCSQLMDLTLGYQTMRRRLPARD